MFFPWHLISGRFNLYLKFNASCMFCLRNSSYWRHTSVLNIQPLVVFSVFHMWIAWTVCCLNKHRGLTAVRNRLRSQTPPTHFHTVIHCVVTLPLRDSRSHYTVFSFCLIQARPEFYHLSSAHTQRSYAVDTRNAKSTQLCLQGEVGLMTDLSQTDTAVPLWHLNLTLVWIFTDGENHASVFEPFPRPLHSSINRHYIWCNR